jgi:hypothetical protein
MNKYKFIENIINNDIYYSTNSIINTNLYFWVWYLHKKFPTIPDPEEVIKTYKEDFPLTSYGKIYNDIKITIEDELFNLFDIRNHFRERYIYKYGIFGWYKNDRRPLTFNIIDLMRILHIDQSTFRSDEENDEDLDRTNDIKIVRYLITNKKYDSALDYVSKFGIISAKIIKYLIKNNDDVFNFVYKLLLIPDIKLNDIAQDVVKIILVYYISVWIYYYGYKLVELFRFLIQHNVLDIPTITETINYAITEELSEDMINTLQKALMKLQSQ